MTERYFRLILGTTLIILLFIQNHTLVYAYIGLLLFEAITNWRVPDIVNRLFKIPAPNEAPCGRTAFNFEAERILRIVVATLLILSYILFPEVLWLLPWFVAFMLFMAGMTNICPMTIFFSWLGFR